MHTVTARPGWSSSCQRQAHKVLFVLPSKGQRCPTGGRLAEQVMTDLTVGNDSGCCCWQLLCQGAEGAVVPRESLCSCQGPPPTREGSGGSQGQQALAETKHVGAEEGNLCHHH